MCGGVEVQLQAILILETDGGYRHLPAALCPGRKKKVPTGKETGMPRTGLDVMEKRNSFASSENQTRSHRF
jgi:hypothetical protein